MSLTVTRRSRSVSPAVAAMIVAAAAGLGACGSDVVETRDAGRVDTAASNDHANAADVIMNADASDGGAGGDARDAAFADANGAGDTTVADGANDAVSANDATPPSDVAPMDVVPPGDAADAVDATDATDTADATDATDRADATDAIDATPLELVYDVPGDYQWQVPAGVTSVVVDVYGAEGGENFASYPTMDPVAGTTPGGRGAHVTATLTVTPGQRLEIEVGEKGRYFINTPAMGYLESGFGLVLGYGSNGRQLANGEAGTDAAGNGGGASAVVLLAGTRTTLVVAGAGGGAGAVNAPGSEVYANGGRGGDSGHPGGPGVDKIVPTTGCTVFHGEGGQPGTLTAPGQGGLAGENGCTALANSYAGNPGLDGDYFVGQGAGGTGGLYGAGGGGGGYHAGGGGGSGALHGGDPSEARVAGGGGGGGGSSYVASVASGGMIVDGVRIGHGRVEIHGK